MNAKQFAFPGIAQVPCAICGHPRTIHHDLEGSCNVFCGCKRWIAPVGWELLSTDYFVNLM
jgi:hypothetical protein